MGKLRLTRATYYRKKAIGAKLETTTPHREKTVRPIWDFVNAMMKAS